MFGKLGWLEVVLIIGVVLIIFGPGKLVGLTKSVVDAFRGLKKEADIQDKEEHKEEGPREKPIS